MSLGPEWSQAALTNKTFHKGGNGVPCVLPDMVTTSTC